MPLNVTSPVVKSLTGSLKTTVKLIGEAFVGSAVADAWLIVTVGAMVSTTIVEVAVAVLKGVVPPLTVASTIVPCLPAVLPVWSQARKLIVSVLSLGPLGT